MRVLVLGAGGFIGRHLCQRLQAAGHTSVVGRPDWSNAADPAAWRPLVEGVDAAVYLPGTLRDRALGRRGWLDLLHHQAPLALLNAGVARLVHVSALCGGQSQYALSKQAGDAALRMAAQQSGQVLHVVRPSLVVGTGGVSSRLLTRLARWPVLALPQAMQHCRVQPMRVEDLTDGLVALLSDADRGEPLAAAGPDIDTLAGWIARRRALSGAAPARVVSLPDALTRLSARLGEPLSRLSWNCQALELLGSDSIAPDATSTAWWPELLGRPLRSAMEGPW